MMTRTEQALETSNKELAKLTKRYRAEPTRANRLMVDYERHINSRIRRAAEKYCK